MMEQLLDLLLKVLAPVIAFVTAAIVAWVLKRAVRAGIEARHGGSGGPIWFLSAAILGLACLIVAVRSLWTETVWIDPTTLTWLARLAVEEAPPVRELVFPFSTFWLAGALIIGTILYVLLTLLLAWLIGLPRAAAPGRAEGAEKSQAPNARKRGLPPDSAAASAKEQRMGLLMSLDSAASAGAIEWLYGRLGYWDDPRSGSEPRYRSWLEPIHDTLAWIKWLSLPVAAFGVTSALAWITAALLHDALAQLLALPPGPPEPEEEPLEEPEEEEADWELAESELISRLSQELGGAGLCIRPLGSSSARKTRRADERWPRAAMGPLWESVLDRWQGESEDTPGFWPYLHQEETAAHLLERDDVLLHCLPSSGRSTIVDLVAAHMALCRSGSVLVIAVDEEDAQARVAALKELGRNGGWHWIIRAHDLATQGIDGLDPLVAHPEVVVGTVDTLERDFMAVAGHWDVFLATLSLIVIPDVDHHWGARAASLGALCRRLLLLAEDGGATPRILCTGSGLWQETTRLAEEVTSRSLVVVDQSSNGAPRASQAGYLVGGGAGLTERIRQSVADAGWGCHVVGREPSGLGSQSSTLTAAQSAAHTIDAGQRLALVAPVSASHLPATSRSLAYLPVGLPPAVKRVLLFHVHQPDTPLSTALLEADRTGEPVGAWIDRSPVLPNGWGNPAAAAQALQRALGERESTRSELEEHHGSRATDHELGVLSDRGLLTERLSAAPDAASGLPLPVTLYRLSDPAKVRIASSSAVVTSEPFDLTEGSTRDELLAVDRVRADVALYPGRVFVEQCRRYRVSDDVDTVVAEPEPEQVWTLPIRTVAVELDGWSPRPLRLAGETPLESGRGNVTLRIEVTGLRRFGIGRELLDERMLPEPALAAYPSRAAVVLFPPHDLATPGAVHALVHLARAALPLVVRSKTLDLDLVPLPADENGARGFAIVDLHPFGAGFADAFRASRIRELLDCALRLVREAPETAGPAMCMSPTDSWDEPDAAAARKLLEEVLGPPATP